jgi:hypothetical protein
MFFMLYFIGIYVCIYFYSDNILNQLLWVHYLISLSLFLSIIFTILLVNTITH